MTRRALITGGQRGIGRAIAQALYADGVEIVLTGPDQPDSDDVAAACAAMPGARYLRHDIRDLDAIPDLLAAAGPITTLVSNAGVGAMQRGDLLDMSVESFDRCHAVNLRGAFFLAQAVARQMCDDPVPGAYRALIFITSVSAQMASPDRAEYCISKAGAAMMAQSFATRLAPEGIGVFDIRPGIIRTGMTAPVADRYDTAIAEGLVPARRWGETDDIAKVVLPIARGEMAFSTGAVIPADGGLSIQRL